MDTGLVTARIDRLVLFGRDTHVLMMCIQISATNSLSPPPHSLSLSASVAVSIRKHLIFIEF